MKWSEVNIKGNYSTKAQCSWQKVWLWLYRKDRNGTRINMVLLIEKFKEFLKLISTSSVTILWTALWLFRLSFLVSYWFGAWGEGTNMIREKQAVFWNQEPLWILNIEVNWIQLASPVLLSYRNITWLHLFILKGCSNYRVNLAWINAHGIQKNLTHIPCKNASYKKGKVCTTHHWFILPLINIIYISFLQQHVNLGSYQYASPNWLGSELEIKVF